MKIWLQLFFSGLAFTTNSDNNTKPTATWLKSREIEAKSLNKGFHTLCIFCGHYWTLSFAGRLFERNQTPRSCRVNCLSTSPTPTIVVNYFSTVQFAFDCDDLRIAAILRLDKGPESRTAEETLNEKMFFFKQNFLALSSRSQRGFSG